jgi:hypothetical protein
MTPTPVDNSAARASVRCFPSATGPRLDSGGGGQPGRSPVRKCQPLCVGWIRGPEACSWAEAREHEAARSGTFGCRECDRHSQVRSAIRTPHPAITNLPQHLQPGLATAWPNRHPGPAPHRQARPTTGRHNPAPTHLPSIPRPRQPRARLATASRPGTRRSTGQPKAQPRSPDPGHREPTGHQAWQRS